MRLLLLTLFASAISFSSTSAAVIRQFEFDEATLALAGFEDFQTRGNATIGNGLISGLSNPTGNRDVQLRSLSTVFNPVVAGELPLGGSVSVRFRESVSLSTDEFLTAQNVTDFANNRLFINGPSFPGTIVGLPSSVVDDGDNFIVATWDLPVNETFSTVRFDPVDNEGNVTTGLAGAGVTFDVDFIRVTATPIPEPSSLALLGVCGVANLVRRRRRA